MLTVLSRIIAELHIAIAVKEPLIIPLILNVKHAPGLFALVVHVVAVGEDDSNKSLQHRSGTSCLRWTAFKSQFCGSLRSLCRKTTT